MEAGSPITCGRLKKSPGSQTEAAGQDYMPGPVKFQRQGQRPILGAFVWHGKHGGLDFTMHRESETPIRWELVVTGPGPGKHQRTMHPTWQAAYDEAQKVARTLGKSD
jgi:hypothetical protein